jgi:similar to stage IV sporulation protein
MLFFYRYFCGILKVEFFGTYPEKILNLAAKHKISIWSARYENCKISCKITVKDFLKLRKILRKSGIRVHILQKIGFPFFIKKYNKRAGIFVGLVIFFAFLYLMSSHIWIIDVEGSEKVSEAQIISVCKELGIEQGTKKSKINAKADAQDLLLKIDKLAWSSLNIEGSKLTVNVTEITEKEEDNSLATNLKADSDGIITHIDVTSGNCLVKVGDVVRKGDVLVSGIIENESGTRFVHSIGKIIAKTEKEVSLYRDFLYKITYPTGKTKKRHVLEFFTIKIPLYLGREKGEFKTQNEVFEAKLFSQKLPIKIYSKKFNFQKSQTQKIGYNKAVELLEKELLLEEYDKIKSKDFIKDENGVKLIAILEKEKNIAKAEKIILGIGK